jgi:hypothetical protein
MVEPVALKLHHGETPLTQAPQRYLYADKDRYGNIRWYFWRGKGRKKIRIHEVAGSPEFHLRYGQLLAGESTPPEVKKNIILVKPHTFRWLCVEVRGLNGRVPGVRKRVLESCCDEPYAPGSTKFYADFPLSQMTVEALEVSQGPEAALDRGSR